MWSLLLAAMSQRVVTVVEVAAVAVAVFVLSSSPWLLDF